MFLEKMRCFFSIFPVISASKPMKMAKTDFRGFFPVVFDTTPYPWYTSVYYVAKFIRCKLTFLFP